MLTRIVFVLLVSFSGTTKADLDLDHKIEVLKNYFDIDGLVFNTTDVVLALRYSDHVIQKMREILSIKDDQNFERIEDGNSEVNMMILKDQIGSKPEVWVYGVFIDSTLNALDLIVPNSEAEPELELYKKELRKFAASHRDLAEELLGKVNEPMEDGVLHTYEAIRFLKNAYYHWIPLADLEGYMEQVSANS